jgi:hypothetical protein
MKRFFAAAIIVICVSGVVSAADKQLLGFMMPDAKVLGGMNVTQVLASPYGQYLLSKVPMGQPDFQNFVIATGFDPFHNISEVVAASAGNPGDKSGLAAVRGSFNVAQIVAFAKQNGAAVDESRGIPMISSPDGQVAIALVDNTLALAGDPNSVIAALARGSAQSVLDPALVAKADTLSASNDAWGVTSVTPGAVGLPQVPKSGAIDISALQNIQQSSAGIKFGTSVNVTAEVIADTPQNADSLAGLARLLVGVAQMGGRSNPDAAQFLALLQNLSIRTAGTAVQLSVAIPEDLLEQLAPPSHPSHRVVRKVVDRQR